MDKILDCLTRGLDLNILSRGYGDGEPRRAGQLPGAVAGAGAGAAVELARRAHALAAGHPAADRPGAQARPAGAVDAVPHGRRVHRGRHSARGDLASIPGGGDVGAAVLDSLPAQP